MDSLQGRHFACLPRLRELRVNVTRHLLDLSDRLSVDVAGLPARLHSFEVGSLRQMSQCNALWSVSPRPIPVGSVSLL